MTCAPQQHVQLSYGTGSQLGEQDTCLCNVALSMAEGPDNGVDDELELVRRHGEEGPKAVIGDGSQQAEELQAVLRELLHGDSPAMHRDIGASGTDSDQAGP